MLQINHLTKRYGKLRAVDDISLHLQSGEIAILLGPNGAGKTTLLKSAAGLLKCQGEVRIGGLPGHNPESRRHMGYVPEIPLISDLLTVKEQVRFIAAAYGWMTPDSEPETEKMIDDLLMRFHLSDKQDSPCSNLSKGMQQKVSLCCAAILRPRLLLLDEPMVGLDPQAIRDLKEMLSVWREGGTAILISTHILDLVSGLWDRLFIMKSGKIIHVQQNNHDLDSSSLEDIYLGETGGASA